MLKTAQILKITSNWIADSQAIESALDGSRFTECGASQELSFGWVEPRGEAHGPLLEVVGGQLFLKLKTETKSVPGAVITRKAKERVSEIESATGRKPGKKELREIKEEIKLALLPVAFAKESTTLVWIDPVAFRLVIDASSSATVDAVVTLLVKAIDGLAVAVASTKVSPTAAMSEWLITQEPPVGFTVDRECELKAADESKATIKFGKSPLDTEEVKNYVESGKLPTKLALTWDGRVSFVLTDKGILNKIDFLDMVLDRQSAVEKDAGFDADVAIATGELRKLIPDLLDALGGEADAKADAIAEGGTASATGSYAVA